MTDRIATYRLQFRDGMDFDGAIGILPYLKRLGVSHLYASPIFTATPGSAHGYDVTDFNSIDPVLGGRQGFERLSEALRAAGMGLMLDIVPNHMAAAPENPWWRDVAEWGEAARHAGHFDIDWRERLTLPVLGQPFDAALEDGEIAVAVDAEQRGLVLSYFDLAYPLTPPSYRLLAEASGGKGVLSDLAAIAAEARPEEAEAFHAAMRDRLSRPEAEQTLNAALSGLSRDRDLLARLHTAQPWQLIFWREARHHLSYRRFFEVTGLVGTRVEDPDVFDDVHSLVLDLMKDGHVDALRVDHVDGLSDPGAYLKRLRGIAGDETWIVVEKILEGDETLPPGWPVEGTTGYEFIATMAGLLVPARGREALEQAYAEMSDTAPVAQRLEVAKRRIVTHNFEGELSRVCELVAPHVPEELSAEALREALVALIVALPVYRTYGDAEGFDEHDQELLRRTAARAGEAAGHQAVSAALAGLSEREAHEARARFQQLTGPAMAKAVEDTLFYRHNAVLALNEVGCDPVHRSEDDADIHQSLAERRRLQPFGLTGTATHDTKRGEDARARLYTLAEAPEAWAGAVSRWRGWASDRVHGGVPGPGLEWMIYQALAGVWPADGDPPDTDALVTLRERFLGYLVKALREAKLRTSWTGSDEEYEAAVCAYAEALLSPENGGFQRDFHATLLPFAAAGRIASLVQTLLKLTAPGIPDIYQGTEAGDFSLVDPDNRRPVDYAALDRMLDARQNDDTPDLGVAKSYLLHRCLAARGQHPELFSHGAYYPLEVAGERGDEAFAFIRTLEGAHAVTVVPVRPFALRAASRQGGRAYWADTRVHLPDALPPLASVLTGERITERTPWVADLFDGFPVALLLAEGSDG